MNTTKNHHATIFTTPHRLHFLITGRCTYDALLEATYKPYLAGATVPVELASFEIEERDMNGRKVRFGEFTGEDGAILWHDEFSTVADATTALLEELRSMSEQIAGHVSVLATAAAETVVRSLKTGAPDHSVTYDAEEEKCSPRVAPPNGVEEDGERLDAQDLHTSLRRELALLNRTLRKRFAARRRVELAAVLDSTGGVAFSWMHLNRKAREALCSAGGKVLGIDLAHPPYFRLERSAFSFVRHLNKQLAQDELRPC
jgi:hypothetical protein